MDYPRLITPIAFSFLALCSFLAARYADRVPEWGRALFVFSGIVFAVFAVATGIDWMAHNAAVRITEIRRAAAISERVRLAETVQRMDPVQLQALTVYVPLVNVLGGLPGPVMTLVTPWGEVPFEFIRKFSGLSNDEFLCPVGKFSEGSSDRKYAVWFTNYMVLMGYALPASGNRSAQWVDRNAAMKSIGLREMEL